VDTVQSLESKLLPLEKTHYTALNEHFRWPKIKGLRDCITGGVQFAAIDKHHLHCTTRKPVVAIVGVNYTQGPPDADNKHLYPYNGNNGIPSVLATTGSCPAVTYIIAAYNRNIKEWERPQRAPMPAASAAWGRVAAMAPDLINKDPRQIKDKFILVLTNLCPFITQLEWQEQMETTPNACKYLLGSWGTHRPNKHSKPYLDELYDCLSGSVDLWIGHSAVYGTEWVYPYFREFVDGKKISNWLLAPNISPRAHLYLDGTFRKTGHRFLPLFGPEKPQAKPKRSSAPKL